MKNNIKKSTLQALTAVIGSSFIDVDIDVIEEKIFDLLREIGLLRDDEGKSFDISNGNIIFRNAAGREIQFCGEKVATIGLEVLYDIQFPDGQWGKDMVEILTISKNEVNLPTKDAYEFTYEEGKYFARLV